MAIFVYIAKANYLLGKSHKDPAFFMKASLCLQEALYYSPFDHTLRFNLALCQQEYALAVLQKNITARSFTEVSRAINDLDVASLTFEVLGDLSWSDEGARTFYDPKVAKQRAKFCQSAKLTAQKQYQKQMEEEKLREEKLKQLKLLREAGLEKQKLIEDEAQRKKAIEKAEIDQHRKLAYEKARHLQANLQATSTNAEEEKDMISDDEDEDEDDDINSSVHFKKTEKRNIITEDETEYFQEPEAYNEKSNTNSTGVLDEIMSDSNTPKENEDTIMSI